MELSHLDKEGKIQMVDTSEKPVSTRRAVAAGRVNISQAVLEAVKKRSPKGDPVETARLAGIMAAKKTADLIPLCHPLNLTHIDVSIELRSDHFYLTATVSTNAQTGVEMEALTAVTVAGLTIYDMCKAVDKTITITDIKLLEKTGGKSGNFTA
jgi:cyclic pyranopterin monophosphate synthase